MEYGNSDRCDSSQNNDFGPFGPNWEEELDSQFQFRKCSTGPLELQEPGSEADSSQGLSSFRPTTFEERLQQSIGDADLIRPVLDTLFLGSTITQVEGQGSQLSDVLDASAKIDYLVTTTPGSEVLGIGLRMTRGTYDTLTMSVSQYRCLAERWHNGRILEGVITPTYLVQGYVICDRYGNRKLRSAVVVRTSKFFTWANSNPGQLRYSHFGNTGFYAWKFAQLIECGITDAVFPIQSLLSVH